MADVVALEAPGDIVPEDVWTLIPTDGLGVGTWAIPAGAEVTILDILDPFSPGVAQSNEFTIRATYSFADFSYDETGNLVESQNTRTLAYAESLFRALFVRAVGGGA